MTEMSTAARAQLVADIGAAIPKCKTATDLVGFGVCAVVDLVIFDARAAGNDDPNVGAIFEAATRYVVEMVAGELPKVWARYCAENGLPV